MMIEFKDFYRDISKKEGLEIAVKRMNDYLTINAVKVINVETVSDGGGSNSVNSLSVIGVRLWFESNSQ